MAEWIVETQSAKKLGHLMRQLDDEITRKFFTAAAANNNSTRKP